MGNLCQLPLHKNLFLSDKNNIARIVLLITYPVVAKPFLYYSTAPEKKHILPF
jgi:hypothetical protein